LGVVFVIARLGVVFVMQKGSCFVMYDTFIPSGYFAKP